MSTTAKHPLHGIAFLIGALACFSTLDTTVKYLSLSISVLIVLWFRFIFHAATMTVTLLHSRGIAGLKTHHPWLHVIRGLVLLLSSTAGFSSLQFIAIGEFTAIMMLTPLMITLLAAVFLKEEVNLLRWLLVGGGFSGALLVVQPSGDDMGWPVLLPLIAMLLNAVFQILTSRMARTEDPLVMHLYTGWVGALSMTAVLPWIWQTIPSSHIWMLLCLAGSVATLAHFLLILAFARAPASTLAPYVYTQIVFALLAGWWMFGHVPGQLELLGIALIVACGATTAMISSRIPKHN